ncbi:hypothetical protein QNH10_12865 [Sporosarcina thermotolerans]|nr:hypothetical protein [Sporosarcina thermotolerans]WHT47149.1 hypothetical protein QNH10_12865 [Sporosarcina thermotolerans]
MVAKLAMDKVFEELSVPNNLFEQQKIFVSEMWVEEETDTLIVGLLVLNRKNEKEFKVILEKMYNQKVRIKFIQSDGATVY